MDVITMDVIQLNIVQVTIANSDLEKIEAYCKTFYFVQGKIRFFKSLMSEEIREGPTILSNVKAESEWSSN